ncbi:MAG: phosphatase PAP2 family protein [Promethearchaeota archaeon]
MTEFTEILPKRSLIIIGLICFILFIIGMILLILNYNEAFYIENSVVQLLFEIITFTGNSLFLILTIAVFYFIYDKRFAKNFFLMWIFSGSINSMLKEIVKEPRPDTNFTHASERGYSSSGYGFPSGHAQVAASNWGLTAYEFKNKARPNIIPVIFSIFIFLVALSRVIIGVHSIKQIVWGLLIGIIILIAFLYLEPIISEKFNMLSISMKIVLAIIISVLFAITGTLLFPEFSGYGVNIYAVSGGSLMGLSIGYILEGEYVNYEPSELNSKQKAINLTIGVVILMIFLIFIYGLIIGNDLLLFIQNAILSLIITFLMPLVFKKIKRA